ncbi:hypothetical protein [Cobetia crustatorum]|nr:hypothetical protein [Cobetia crustatorum]
MAFKMCLKNNLKIRLRFLADNSCFDTLSKMHSDKLDRVASRPLTAEEKQELRRDMQESSAWAKAELKRRRDAKNQKNSAHGIDNGIDNERIAK